MKRSRLALALLAAGCQGSWAEATIVHLDPIASSAVKGIAVVAQGCSYTANPRCFPDGTLIKSQILSAASKTEQYRVLLVKGNCAEPAAKGIEVGAGETAGGPGGSTKLAIPIVELTGGTYVLVVRAHQGMPVACGTIRRDGPV
jgi:hypothetical protein